MDTTDVFYTIFIILLFVLLYVKSILETRRKAVSANWAALKCNPSIMPFASYYGPDGTSTSANFAECMAEMQTSSIFDILGPINDAVGSITDFGDAVQSEILGIKKFLNVLINTINETFSIFFVLISNIIAGIYKILANMRDTTERIVVLNESIKIVLNRTAAELRLVSKADKDESKAGKDESKTE